MGLGLPIAQSTINREFPGGKDAGCAVFIDRQLAGPYGGSEGLYASRPFHAGTKEQGAQSPINPRGQ